MRARRSCGDCWFLVKGKKDIGIAGMKKGSVPVNQGTGSERYNGDPPVCGSCVWQCLTAGTWANSVRYRSAEVSVPGGLAELAPVCKPQPLFCTRNMGLPSD